MFLTTERNSQSRAEFLPPPLPHENGGCAATDASESDGHPPAHVPASPINDNNFVRTAADKLADFFDEQADIKKAVKVDCDNGDRTNDTRKY